VDGPDGEGGVDFEAFAVSANGNNNASGDGAGDARTSTDLRLPRRAGLLRQ
jgi:hypothetical protein